MEQTLQKIQGAAEGLLYRSESDFPFEVVHHTASLSSLEEALLRISPNRMGSGHYNVLPMAQFFANHDLEGALRSLGEEVRIYTVATLMHTITNVRVLHTMFPNNAQELESLEDECWIYKNYGYDMGSQPVKAFVAQLGRSIEMLPDAVPYLDALFTE